MNEKELINYYNKFNEDKRLNTRHGIIEFKTTIKYILKYLNKNDKIIEIGAGTGKYSGYLASKEYNVTAVELVKHNLRIIEKNYPNVKTIQANAIDLKLIPDNTYDVVLLFGPMYHLISKEEKIKALTEAKRIIKKNGIIMSIYIMNDYAILKHAFLDNNFDSEKEKISSNYKVIPSPHDLYSYVTLSEIDNLNKEVNLKRIKIISQDGLTDYFRKEINEMNKETFENYLKFHLNNCEKYEMLGYCSHILDILRK